VPRTGPLAHVDLTVGHPERSIPFYAAFFAALGYRRERISSPDFEGPSPTRASWVIDYGDGASFDVELRPARFESRDRPHDRYQPGLHHLAFHAESRTDVERVHRGMLAIGATVLDPPTDYPEYGAGYYAVFFADPDGVKLEVVHIP
jgi:catechol 2,3-dioxygenase-like lactoylglutathione lyase family enzyme